MCLCTGGFCVCTKMCARWLRSVFVLVVFCFCLSHGHTSFSNITRIKREALTESLEVYLMNFGYMEKSKDGAFALRTEESVKSSLRDMQEFAGLPVTGRLDERTLKLMHTPRCGMPDKNFRTRRKRFTIHGSKWRYLNLTWSVRTRNVDNLNFDEVRYVISRALQVWSKHSKLTFQEVDSDKADILIYFHRGSHGDNFPFDGPGKVLAHAFFPTGGWSSVEVHFDADEKWTTNFDNEDGTNLFNVAAHEIGHSLGLSHSNVESALMYPWYKEMENGYDYELPDDDKQAIQFLYGAPEGGNSKWAKNPEYHPQPTTTTTTTTTTTRPPRPTPRRRPQNPRQYPYPTYSPYYPQKPMDPSKKHYYPNQNAGYPYSPDRKYPKKLPERNYPVSPTKRYPYRPPETAPPRTYAPRTYQPRGPERHYPPNPLPPRTTAKPAPDTCNTSYDAISVIRREVFIFKDAYFWRIGDNGLMPGYPALIRRLWHGLPEDLTHVDAVYERNDGRIVFFIGDKYYVFLDNHVENGYPRPLFHLGLPREIKKIDGAMVWGHNGKTYFYSGNMYWRFDEEVQKVELDYPRDMSMWKGVGTDIDAVFQWKDGKTYFFKGKGFWKFNDYHMRVEHEKPRLSAPFWMGCTTNYEENKNNQATTTRTKEYSRTHSRTSHPTPHTTRKHYNTVGEKMPLKDASRETASSATSHSLNVLLVFAVFYGIYHGI
ncbi:matrix metalloproteinase-2-like [Diabrotica virgifera virgifera]|uniref:Matrix metalloproteinase-2-like n=1 Tax=Diabrotica virgifera virgifera TaxID=50390 RepID=A0A6P7G9M5_DIAVI|nr:matrix metalloproteinase-2-like [Diabrotica virgifera virgifera]